MSDRLATLHDPDDSRLTLEVAILGDTLVRLLVFLLRLFQLHLINADPVLGVREGLVDADDGVTGELDVDIVVMDCGMWLCRIGGGI